MKQQIFSLDKSVLKRANNTSVKLRGIHLDSQFILNMKIDNLCTKFAKVTYLLQKLKGFISIEILVTSYYVFCHSH